MERPNGKLIEMVSEIYRNGLITIHNGEINQHCTDEQFNAFQDVMWHLADRFEALTAEEKFMRYNDFKEPNKATVDLAKYWNLIGDVMDSEDECDWVHVEELAVKAAKVRHFWEHNDEIMVTIAAGQIGWQFTDGTYVAEFNYLDYQRYEECYITGEQYKP